MSRRLPSSLLPSSPHHHQDCRAAEQYRLHAGPHRLYVKVKVWMSKKALARDIPFFSDLSLPPSEYWIMTLF
ncbi:hypothetical protein PoB_003733000 [Plakobranchus ocellatus]|uniref:Uncharacterized protein n=1 Tax=Plakobranchus ocellatus TaxID=259542 RepID=A0AAV4ARB1_9GAST|nr:hypothetical protein PoB_003733000 [Plakobranchus ocellatus]